MPHNSIVNYPITSTTLKPTAPAATKEEATQNLRPKIEVTLPHSNGKSENFIRWYPEAQDIITFPPLGQDSIEHDRIQIRIELLLLIRSLLHQARNHHYLQIFKLFF